MGRSIGFVTLGVLGIAVSAQAAVNYTNQVLDIGVGARALGMGGAYVAIADDSTASYWNPAGLTSVQHMEVEAIQQGHQNSALSDGTNDVGSDYFFMSGGLTVPTIGSFGVAVMRFGVTGIDQVSGTLGPGGVPQVLGTFGTSDAAIFASYGREIQPWLDLGVTLKTLNGGTNGLQQDPADGITGNASYQYYGADLGALLKLGKLTPYLDGLTLGLNLQDLVNSGVKWTQDSLPETVNPNEKSGVSYMLPFDFLKDSRSSVTLAVDMDPEYSTLIHYGGEIWYRNIVAFRAGMRQFTSGMQGNEYSYGASFRIYVLQVDYAYIGYELTPIQYLSMLVRF